MIHTIVFFYKKNKKGMNVIDDVVVSHQGRCDASPKSKWLLGPRVLDPN